MQVVGMVSNSFRNKDGEVVNYARLYVTYPPNERESEYTVGMIAEAIKVRPQMLDGLHIGDEVQVLYDKNGRCVNVEVQ